MSIVLEAIMFNHDPTSATTDALNIRRNFSDTVTVPEWRRGVSTLPRDSPAAYVGSQIAGNVITIKAKFRRTSSNITSVEVRAIDPFARPTPSGCNAIFAWFLRGVTDALFGNVNVLGNVAARPVTFSADESDFETFELTSRISRTGVRADTVTWQWQYRLSPSEMWQDMDRTQHLIYLLLDMPTDPWSVEPMTDGNRYLPWTDALDYACWWGRLAGDKDTAASLITDRLYHIGPSVLKYDCPGGGTTNYAYPIFNMSAFIERLRGGRGLGPYVNCSDCATIVSTFSNLVGCDLWQSQLGRDFALNPILAIGTSIWEPACLSSEFGWVGRFDYHEVAWKGACTSNDAVFDACLKVDGDSDPTRAPHTPLLAVNMRFGTPGSGDYRDRLATPAGRPRCEPMPAETRQRREFR
jgi:hypothetical protein